MRDNYSLLPNVIGQKGFSTGALLVLSVGLLHLILGLILYSHGRLSILGAYASVTKPAAVVVILIALFILRMGYKMMVGKEPVKYYKCTGCGHISSPIEAPGQKCPKCSGVLENLEGFYDRHPELRE
jgi:hypothetical protein